MGNGNSKFKSYVDKKANQAFAKKHQERNQPSHLEVFWNDDGNHKIRFALFTGLAILGAGSLAHSGYNAIQDSKDGYTATAHLFSEASCVKDGIANCISDTKPNSSSKITGNTTSTTLPVKKLGVIVCNNVKDQEIKLGDNVNNLVIAANPNLKQLTFQQIQQIEHDYIPVTTLDAINAKLDEAFRAGQFASGVPTDCHA